ncbi:MAG: hypothetical protein ASARMPRED_002882 [Alectoria sarmentosa]|nr:MAG: hypothetical protein ASARMPRED_002882 [Alectoria sarmentosa]
MQDPKAVSIPTIPHQSLPPLLTLPLELKQQIFNHLSHDGIHSLSLAILRRTHPIFRHAIPRQKLIPITPYDSRDLTVPSEYVRNIDLRYEQLHLLEHEYSYLLAPDHYPCYCCGRVLEGRHFKDEEHRHGVGAEKRELIPLLGRTFHDAAIAMTAWYNVPRGSDDD